VTLVGGCACAASGQAADRAIVATPGDEIWARVGQLKTANGKEDDWD
jgi:hypothetical protein